jgi:predicted DCC family thiol-disulfide oxidoreductase YuxK
VQVLYDADCGLCRVSAALLLRWGRRGSLEALPIQGERATRLLAAAGMDEDERLASVHAVLPDGRVLSAGDAVTAVLGILPGAKPLARLSARTPTATARAYHAIADNRSRLGPLIPKRLKHWADRQLAGP